MTRHPYTIAERLALIRSTAEEAQVLERITRDQPTRDDAPQLRLRLRACLDALRVHSRVAAEGAR